MAQLTEQQILKRFDILPKHIKEFLTAGNNIDAVRQICTFHHFDTERTLMVEELVGLVILGFLSLTELSQKISETLHLNRKHSDDIAMEINRKIFAPIRDEIEKNYSPISESITLAREPMPLKDIISIQKKGRDLLVYY